MVFLSFPHTNADTWQIPEPAHIWEPTCTLIPIKLDTYWSMFRRFWIMEVPWTGLKSWVISIALAMPRKLLVQSSKMLRHANLDERRQTQGPLPQESNILYTLSHCDVKAERLSAGRLAFFFFCIFSQNTAIFLPYSSTYTCINLLHQCLHHGGSQGYKNCQLLFIPLISL